MGLEDVERWERLRGVEVARSILRDAFGLSLVFIGPEGPIAHVRGGVMESSSDVCRSVLFTREGFERCNADYREPGATCHMGLSVFVEPIEGQDVRVAASGFARTRDEPDREALLTQLQTFDPNADADVVRGLPIIERSGPVRAVLRTVVAEIEAHEAARRARMQSDGRGMWGILGRSPQMDVVFELLPRLAQSDATALILGESGTGKELVARALHEQGRRAERGFVAQNCAALPDDLLESTLFGYVRGAFSGAARSSEGLFGAADGGTLFLDEVGDMSPALQVKLLRVLQDGVYHPVGSTKSKRSDVRVVAATHKDLMGLVQAGSFRQDLFYRLHVLPIRLPPLRDRVGDVRLLVEHFQAEANLERRVSEAAWECIERYRWPGNVRELRAEIQRWQLTAADAEVIGPEHLTAAIRDAGGYAAFEGASAVAAVRGEATLAEAVESLERSIIQRGLERTGGNRTQLARELGISRTTLAERLKRYGLE